MMVHFHDAPDTIDQCLIWIHFYINQEDLPLADLAMMGTWRLRHRAFPAIPLA